MELKMAQWIKHLLHKLKNLNLNPKHPCQETSMVMHARNPAWCAETGGFQEPLGLSVYLIGHLQVW